MILYKGLLSAALMITGTLLAQEKLEKKDKEWKSFKFPGKIFTIPDSGRKFWRVVPDSLKRPQIAGNTLRMPMYKPDENIDYKIMKFRPDSTVDYKILKKYYKVDNLNKKK